MTTSTSSRQAIRRLQRLAGAGLDDETLRLEAMAALGRAIPADGWAWATSDPASQLASSALTDHPLAPRMLALLRAEEDPRELNRRAAMVRSRTPAAALSAATGGQLHRSGRWREHLAEHGIGDELRLLFADRTGCWGYLDLYTSGPRRYTEDDLELARTAVGLLTGPLRRAPAPAAGRSAPGQPVPGALRDPAVLILSPSLQLLAQTGPAGQWLPLLRVGAGDPLPCAVLAATARALAGPGAGPGADADDQPAMARQRGADGQWATVRAARLDTGDIAVTIDHSRPGEVLSYLARAAGLTRREHEVLALLYRGADTHAIAGGLVIAETTAHDHVKNILAKTGHTSRRALLASMSPPVSTLDGRPAGGMVPGPSGRRLRVCVTDVYFIDGYDDDSGGSRGARPACRPG